MFLLFCAQRVASPAAVVEWICDTLTMKTHNYNVKLIKIKRTKDYMLYDIYGEIHMVYAKVIVYL